METTNKIKSQLNIWVQPDDWDGEENERPIKELVVSTNSYLDSNPADSAEAVTQTIKPCMCLINSIPLLVSAMPTGTIHWAVTHLASSELDSRSRLGECKERQYRSYLLPSGVPLQDVENFWKSLNFSGPKSPEELAALAVPTQDNFQYPYAMIKMLRRLAREGRDDTERMRQAELGKRKVVLGMVDELSEEELRAWKVQTVAESSAAVIDAWKRQGEEAPEDSSLVEAAALSLTQSGPSFGMTSDEIAEAEGDRHGMLDDDKELPIGDRELGEQDELDSDEVFSDPDPDNDDDLHEGEEEEEDWSLEDRPSRLSDPDDPWSRLPEATRPADIPMWKAQKRD